MTRKTIEAGEDMRLSLPIGIGETSTIALHNFAEATLRLVITLEDGTVIAVPVASGPSAAPITLTRGTGTPPELHLYIGEATAPPGARLQ